MEGKKPVHILEIKDFNGVKQFENKYETISKILMHEEVKDRKIVVMSIIGKFREGKSFFLDYCLRFLYANYRCVSKSRKPSTNPDAWIGDPNEPLSGFSWKHGFIGDTKGILFWDDVFLHEVRGEKIAIIIMDTQGLFEYGAEAEENLRIFGLSTLLSSIQIINSKGVIGEDQVEYLDIATKLAKFISGKKKTQWKPFQKLIFLIRDWSHKDFSGGFKYEGGQNYLTTFLNQSHRPGSQSQLIRKDIHGSFEEIKCFLLNHPGMIVSDASFKGEWKNLDREFVKNLEILIESIFDDHFLINHKKKVLGKDLTAAEFCEYVNLNFEAYHNAKILETENIYDLMANSQLKAIVEEQIKCYRAQMSEKLDFGQENFEESIMQKHKKAKTEAIAKFNEAEKIDEPERVSKHLSLLTDEIEKCFKDWKDTIMRQYESFNELKENFDQENEQSREELKKLQGELENQAQKFAEVKETFKKDKKRQEKQAQLMKSQINQLNLTRVEKDKEINKIKEDMENQAKKFDKMSKELKEKQEEEMKKLRKELEEAKKKQGGAVFDIGGLLGGIASLLRAVLPGGNR